MLVQSCYESLFVSVTIVWMFYFWRTRRNFYTVCDTATHHDYTTAHYNDCASTDTNHGDYDANHGDYDAVTHHCGGHDYGIDVHG